MPQRGVLALFSNSMGSNNGANGVSAMQTNITGTENTAISAYALYGTTTVSDNTATGAFALTLRSQGRSHPSLCCCCRSPCSGSAIVPLGGIALSDGMRAPEGCDASQGVGELRALVGSRQEK